MPDGFTEKYCFAVKKYILKICIIKEMYYGKRSKENCKDIVN